MAKLVLNRRTMLRGMLAGSAVALTGLVILTRAVV